MANNQIGISFLPSQENAEMGPRRGGIEGDLQQAWKILSLRLPRVAGARSPINPTLLRGQGAGGLGGGMNPNAAVFQAMVEAMIGGGGGSGPSTRVVPGTGQPPAQPPQVGGPLAGGGGMTQREPRPPRNPMGPLRY